MKWKKEATEFTVSVNFHNQRGYQATIPKPIMKLLGDPHKITFIKEGKGIKLVSEVFING